MPCKPAGEVSNVERCVLPGRDGEQCGVIYSALACSSVSMGLRPSGIQKQCFKRETFRNIGFQRLQ